MLRLFFVLVFFFFTLNYAATETDPDALRECGDLHRIDIHTVANAHAEYSNNKCMLTCYEGNKTLSVNAISEGYVCDQASQSKCRNGHCNGLEAVHQCSTLHHLDLSNFKTAGTEYSDDLCTLICVIEGKVASINPVNEGVFCNSVPNGICRNGSCVLASQNTTISTIILTTIPTTIPTTIQTFKSTTTPVLINTKLIKGCQELLVKAEEAIRFLSHDSKEAHEVTVLKTEVAKVKVLITELNAATEPTVIAKIESTLNSAANKLAFEIKKVEAIHGKLPTV